MTARAPGRLLAAGRAADVFELNGRWVLRRYRSAFNAEREAEIMTYARSHGYPVPEVRDASGPDLVMERLSGHTMLDVMSRKPWTVLSQARLLADLHVRLHAIQAPPCLESVSGHGDVLIHRDLHPLNVMLTSGGPVVIDWSNAMRGDGNEDVAETWILMASAEPPGGTWNRMLARIGRKLFVREFLKPFDRGLLSGHVPAIAALRQRDRHLTDRERGAIERFVRAVAGGVS